MSSNYYYRLNIPKNPLLRRPRLNKETSSHGGVTYPHNREQARSILAPETLSIFESIGLDVDCCFYFLRTPTDARPERHDAGLIHSDRHFVNDVLVPWHFGINYEITDTVTTLSWWDPTTADPVPASKQATNQMLCGVSYGGMSGPLDQQYKLLASVDIDRTTPTLVNTFIPHSSKFYGTSKTRVGLTIRFSNPVTCWEEVVELCKPLMEEHNDNKKDV
jgi:hypothetical protein